MQGPFNMEVSSTTLLLTQGTTAKQWGQNIFEKAFDLLKSNDYKEHQLTFPILVD